MEQSTGVLSPAGMPLADIRDVTVDPNLPKEERIAEFLRQIKNPYCFSQYLSLCRVLRLL